MLWHSFRSHPNLSTVGCLTRIGCAVVLVAGAAGGYWLYGDRLPSVLSRAATGATNRITQTAARASQRYDSADGPAIARQQDEARRSDLKDQDRKLGWVSISLAAGSDASKTRKAATDKALAPLSSRTGPAYISLLPPEIVDLVGPALAAQLPPSTTHPELALKGDRLLLRAVVSLADFAGTGGLRNALGGILDGRDTLYLAGPLEPVRPGLVQLRVVELRLRGIDVPNRLIPSLVRSLRRFGEQNGVHKNERIDPGTGITGQATGLVGDAGKPEGEGIKDPEKSEGLALDGLLIQLPSSVSDARVVGGRLTLYRAEFATGATSTPRKP